MSEPDDEWVMTDHSPNVAMAHAYQSAYTARAQLARVIDPVAGMTQIPDAFQAVKAVRNVRQAAAMALEHLTDPAAKDQLKEALADFDEAHPHVCDVRNVLEHCDDYARGIGHLQQPSVKPRDRKPDEQLARRFRIDFDWIDHDPQRPRLRVGSYEIDLVKAVVAASLLVYEIWAAIKVQEGDPVPRSFVATLTDPVERPIIPSPPTWMIDIVKAAGEGEPAPEEHRNENWR